MCQNLQLIKSKARLAWKVVFYDKKDKCYRSPAMGCRYPFPSGKVRGVRKQKRLSLFFSDEILDGFRCGYNRGMAGLTSGFVKKEDAKSFLERISAREMDHERYDPVMVRIVITGTIMKGVHFRALDRQRDVVAGNHIEFLKEYDPRDRPHDCRPNHRNV